MLLEKDRAHGGYRMSEEERGRKKKNDILMGLTQERPLLNSYPEKGRTASKESFLKKQLSPLGSRYIVRAWDCCRDKKMKRNTCHSFEGAKGQIVLPGMTCPLHVSMDPLREQLEKNESKL